MEEALTKDDGLCVVGVFIEAGGNLRYEPVIEVRKVTVAICSDDMKVDQVDFKMLLSENIGHWAAYRGSLTTRRVVDTVNTEDEFTLSSW